MTTNNLELQKGRVRRKGVLRLMGLEAYMSKDVTDVDRLKWPPRRSCLVCFGFFILLHVVSFCLSLSLPLSYSLVFRESAGVWQ